MKISQEIRSQIEATPKNVPANTVGQGSFDIAVQKEATKLRQTELSRLLDQLTQQGEKVAKYRSFQDLAKYKKLVRQFVKEAVQNGLELKQSRSFHLGGQNRKLSIIDMVDEKLLELTESVLNKEKKSIDILDQIGEIKGLLVNLYT